MSIEKKTPNTLKNNI